MGKNKKVNSTNNKYPNSRIIFKKNLHKGTKTLKKN